MTTHECPIDLDRENGITRVPREWACPTCGEDDEDWLIVDTNDDEHIRCTACGNDYHLPHQRGYTQPQGQPRDWALDR